MQGTIGITVLGSGSKGNAIVIQTKEHSFLIDAGFSRKELERRLLLKNIEPSSIDSIIITHEHGDHVNGCRVFSDSHDIPTYGTYGVINALKSKNKVGKHQKMFSSGSPFSLGNCEVTPFAVQHDAVDPVGFIIEIEDVKVGVSTDLGMLNRLSINRLHDCDMLILESNYDYNMQQKSSRPINLIKRVLSKHGHLDNKDTVAAFDKLLTPRTKHIALAHLSNECNDAKLVEDLAKNRLAKMGRDDIVVTVCKQSTPMDTIWL